MFRFIKILKKRSLNNKQKKVNRLYAKDGLTDEVLEKQVQINQQRHKYNITDENEKVYEDFVQ